MPSHAGKKLGLLVCRPEAIQRLSDPLEARGWVVSESAVLAANRAAPALFESASALVVDLDGADNSQLQHLNELVSTEKRPVLFNDSSHDADWSQHLHLKLNDLLGSVETGVDVRVVDEDQLVASELPDAPVEEGSDAAVASFNVWLLSGSLGGPDALREFFRVLLPGLPVSFIVMQRIAREHIDVLANYLKHYTDYSVTVMKTPTLLSDGNIFLVADGSCFSIDNQGIFVPDAILPCEHALDKMMTVLADRYGDSAGAIVFSAIGEDGVEGCDQILAKGGRVFLQQGLAGHFSRFLSQHGAGNQQLEVASAASLAQRLNTLYR